MENWKRLIKVLKQGDAIEYIRKDGCSDFRILEGKPKVKGNELEIDGWITFGVDDDFNKSMYVYIKQDNGDFRRIVIHE